MREGRPLVTDRADALRDALTRFDRKERRLVVSRALGTAGKALDQDFCDEVSCKVKIERLCAHATHWFTDYHLDWLAGALCVYAHGEERCRGQVVGNGEGEERLVYGNQQDIDLLLVRGTDLILIEAKWFGAWDIRQLKGKLKRLSRLRRYASELCRDAGVAQVHMHFLFMSPRKPPRRIRDLWEEHGTGTELGWLRMPAPDGRTSALVVTRCNSDRKSGSKGTHWRLRQIGMPGAPDAE